MNQVQPEGSFIETQLATLGGGCFWCTEALFREVEDVIKVVPGYSGGFLPYPTYEQVLTGTTGHAEVVQIAFNPEFVTFREILQVFFLVHDPTTINRQGADVGSQYRSVIFYHTMEQEVASKEIIKEIDSSRTLDSPIVTQIEPFEAFYEAEDYHKKYYERNPKLSYCQIVISPKISKLQRHHQELNT